MTGRTVVAIIGRDRVTAVRLDDGVIIECDTVVFTGDWIPDHELARRAGAQMVPVATAPSTTNEFHTSTLGLFAIGNLVHPTDTADVCALDGRAVANSVRAWLGDGQWPTPAPPIDVEPPIRWAAHNALGVTIRVDDFVTGRVQLADGRRVISTSRPLHLVPNRAITLRGVDPSRVTSIRLVDERPRR